MSEKDWKTLTEKEVQNEIRRILRESKNEEEFKRKCSNRFGGSMVMTYWEGGWRSAYVASYRWNYSIGARVQV